MRDGPDRGGRTGVVGEVHGEQGASRRSAPLVRAPSGIHRTTMPRRPSDPHDLIGELLGDVPLGSLPTMAEAQRQIEARMREYNERPQEDLGGLSPVQMTELLYSDWSTTGAFRLNEKLSAEDVGDPDMLHNARAFLTALRDEGPAKLTAGGTSRANSSAACCRDCAGPPGTSKTLGW